MSDRAPGIYHVEVMGGGRSWVVRMWANRHNGAPNTHAKSLVHKLTGIKRELLVAHSTLVQAGTEQETGWDGNVVHVETTFGGSAAWLDAWARDPREVLAGVPL